MRRQSHLKLVKTKFQDNNLTTSRDRTQKRTKAVLRKHIIEASSTIIYQLN